MAVAAPAAPARPKARPTAPAKAPAVEPAEQRVVLEGISWKTYELLLADHIDRGPRFAYDRGLLEIMTTSIEHEDTNRTLASVVEITAEELAINYRHAGSTTFKRKDLSQGFEADSCFYIQQVARVRALKKIDLDVDPPPDLVIEIDITNSSLNKFPIYAGLGVPEVWRYSRRRVTISRLERGRYVKAKRSNAFPLLSDEVLTRFLRDFTSMERVDWLRSVRAWVREQAVATQG